MANHIGSFIAGLLLAFLICVLTALFVGSTITVHTNHIDVSGGEGRYILHTTEDDGTIRHSVVDTRSGKTYIFNQDQAEHIILPVDPKALSQPDE